MRAKMNSPASSRICGGFFATILTTKSDRRCDSETHSTDKSRIYALTGLNPICRRAEAVEDADLQLAAQANTLENFSLVYKKKEEAIAIDRMDKNQELVEKYLNDEAFRTAVSTMLVAQVYNAIRARAAAGAPPRAVDACRSVLSPRSTTAAPVRPALRAPRHQKRAPR